MENEGLQNEKFIHYGLLDVFFNSFAYAENFLNTTRVTVTEDLIEVVKMAKVMKVLYMSKELFTIKIPFSR